MPNNIRSFSVKKWIIYSWGSAMSDLSITKSQESCCSWSFSFYCSHLLGLAHTLDCGTLKRKDKEWRSITSYYVNQSSHNLKVMKQCFKNLTCWIWDQPVRWLVWSPLHCSLAVPDWSSSAAVGSIDFRYMFIYVYSFELVEPWPGCLTGYVYLTLTCRTKRWLLENEFLVKLELV
jgi:hypothetical protein